MVGGHELMPAVRGEDGGVGEEGKIAGEKNVGTISMAISTNSTFHKNVVTLMKNVGRNLKKRKILSNIFKDVDKK
jgi:hypothetical protein